MPSVRAGLAVPYNGCVGAKGSYLMMSVWASPLVYGCVLCAVVFAATAEARTVEFSGYTWAVKAVPLGGPGPNRWSDSTDSVWVDEAGKLHLKVRQIGGQWYSSEVTMLQSLGHGRYEFMLETNTETYDPGIVAGLFTYRNDTEEIDIELTQFGDANAPTGWYNIQPYFHAGNQETFDLNLGGSFTSHRFDWTADAIDFRSLHGHYTEPPHSGFIINEWSYTGADIPPDLDEKVHINLWQFQGLAPGNGLEHELIVKSFTFTPEHLLNAIPGDLDGDGFVGIDDLNIVLANWNLSSPPADPAADPSGDSFVGIDDLNTVLGNWNTGTPPGALANGPTVPEPATLTLCLLGASTFLRPSRKMI